MSLISSGSENLAIGISLFMRDGFTANAARASSAMNNLKSNADALAKQQATVARNSNAVGAAVGGAMLMGINKAYGEYASFNYLMKFTALAADDNTKALDKLGAKAIEVGNRTIFSSKEVAEGMRWLAQAGLASNEILSTIDTASDLAASTMSSLGGQNGAADLLARITTAFGIEKNITNMKMVGDVLAYGANKSLTDLTQFGEGMTYAQTTAKRLKISLQETTAAIMMLSNAGIRGTVTGTTLDNMERYLVIAAGGRSRKATNALASIGLSPKDLQDSKGNLLQIGTIFEMLGERTKGLGTVQANQFAIDIFGVRGAKGTSLIENLSKYKEFLDGLNRSQGYSGAMASDMMNSPQGAIDRLKSNWESLKIQFGETVSPLLTPLMQFGAKILDVFGKLLKLPLAGWLVRIGTMWLIIKTGQMAYNAVMLTIRLTQMSLGTTMVTTASSTVSSYGKMTAAATAYGSVLARLRMMGTASAGVGSIGQYKNGQYYQIGPGGGYIPLGKGSYKPGLSRANAFMGKAAVPAMLGGMALGMASDSMGGNTTGAGVGLGVAGDTLSFAGTGAMLGSVIPGVGTLAGAVVGGVAGLMFSLHSRLGELDSSVKDQQGKVNNMPTFNREKWMKDVDMYKNLKYRDRMFNMSGSRVLDNNGNPIQNGRNNGEPMSQTNLTVYVDGERKMNKVFNENDVRETIDLGMQ